MTETTLIAKQRLEALVSFFGANIDADAEETEDGIELSVTRSRTTPRLIGHRGETLRAIEYLLNQMIKRIDEDAPRVLVDVADYKKNRRSKLEEMARDIADRVIKSGNPEKLEPMNPAERRIMHITFRLIEGVESESHGVGRDRHMVVKPVDGITAKPEAEVEVEIEATEAESETAPE